MDFPGSLKVDFVGSQPLLKDLDESGVSRVQGFDIGYVEVYIHGVPEYYHCSVYNIPTTFGSLLGLACLSCISCTALA